jgi:hypothetical protein
MALAGVVCVWMAFVGIAADLSVKSMRRWLAAREVKP